MDRVRLRLAAKRAAQESGASALTNHSEEIAMIVMATLPDNNIREIRRIYKERHQDAGSIFLLVVLPIIVAIISRWITEWLWQQDLAQVVAAARSTLSD